MKYLIRKYQLGGVKTYFQSIGGVVDATKVVPQKLFGTMFENKCGFKNDTYVLISFLKQLMLLMP